LVIAFDVFGEIHVHHVPHIVFVNPHPKGNGRHNDVNFIPDELVLSIHALRARQARMVTGCPKSSIFQLVCHFLRSFS
jgi:hypothetical protein